MNDYLMIDLAEEPEEFLTPESRFFDTNQVCTDIIPFSMYDRYKDAFTARFDTSTVHNCTVIFVRNCSSYLELIGWYEGASIHYYPHLDDKSARYYHISCPSSSAWYFNENYPSISNFLLSKQVRFLEKDEFETIKTRLEDYKVQARSAYIDMDRIFSPKFDGKLENEEEQEIRMRQYEETRDVSLLPTIFAAAKQRQIQEPNCVWANDYMGFVYLQYGYPEEALVYFERALLIDSDNAYSIADKGECLIRLQREKEAVLWFNANLHIKDSDFVRFHLADLYDFLGFPTQAYRVFKTITDPKLLPATQVIILELEEAMPYLANEDIKMNKLDTYYVYLNIEKKRLPEIICDANKTKRYIDPIRKKGVVITSEETVRQKVVSFLLEDLHIPIEYIKVEESLAHIDREFRNRVDILVFGIKGSMRKNLLLVECKACGIPLVGEPTTQILRYNRILQAPFLMLTDGDVSLLYHFKSTTGEYEPLRGLPTYNEMLDEVNIQHAQLPSVSWKRPDFEDLAKPNILYAYRYDGIIGEDTSDELAHFFINFAACLLDDNQRIKCPYEVPGCVITDDHGIKTMSLGNAGGGAYFGNYRWISVCDTKGMRHNIYFSVFATGKAINDPVFGTRKGYTYLICGIEENGQPVSRLQINLDSCVKSEHGGYRITHTGARSRGKIQPLVDYVSEILPELLGDKARFDFGCLTVDKNLYMSDSDVAEVIGNIASYVLLRCELRKIEKGEEL